jgi:DNA primase
MNNNKWTLDEEKKLVLKLRGGYQMKTIAEESGRSYGAIKERLKKIIFENIKDINNQNEVEKVSRSLNLDKELIGKYYYDYEKRLQPKQEQPKQEQPKQEQPKQEQPKQEQPKQEQEQPKPIEQTGGQNLKRQNEMLEDIVKNYELKKQIGNLIRNKKLDEETKDILKKLIIK